MEDRRARGAHARRESEKEMKPRSFRPALVSIFCCVLGLLVGVVAEIIRQLSFERLVKHEAAEFESRGQYPPLIVYMLKPWALPILFAALFGFVGMLLYLLYWWIVAKRSDETPC